MFKPRQWALRKAALSIAAALSVATTLTVLELAARDVQGRGDLPWPPDSEPYEDHARWYDAVRTEAPLASSSGFAFGLGHERIMAIHYEPSDRRVNLGEIRVKDLDFEGRVLLGDLEGARPYEGIRCSANCTRLQMLVADGSTALRLLVPPGERVDVDSVRLDGKQVPVYATSADEPVILLRQPVRALLSYQTGPGPNHVLPPSQGRPLPEPMARKLNAWRSRPLEERVQRATDYVRKILRYSQNPDEAFPNPWIDNEGFLSRTMRVGVGDCDVQNGMLMVLLQELGVPARMGVGFVGREGHTGRSMHAWVEYQREDGTLGITDASLKPTASEPLPELPEEKEAQASATAGQPGTR